MDQAAGRRGVRDQGPPAGRTSNRGQASGTIAVHAEIPVSTLVGNGRSARDRSGSAGLGQDGASWSGG